MHDDAEIHSSERSSQRQPAVERAVFRPGVGQYIYLGWAPALAVLAGLGITVAAMEPQAQDRISILVAGIAVAICGGALLAYVFGMSIEVDEECVSKIYMFGLVRAAIPLQYLQASADTEYSGSASWLELPYTRLDFGSFDEHGDGFSAYPLWVWRRRDMDKLLDLAASMTYWRAYHPTPARPESPPTFGAFLKLAALMTWVGGALAVIPLALVYSKWGGLLALTIGCVIELALIGLSARLTWEPRSPSRKASEGRSERVHLPRGRSRQTGLGEVHDPAATKDGGKLPVAAPESGSMPMHLATQAPPDVLRRTLEATPVRSAREKREPTETGWGYLLSFAALLMLVFGIWAATQSHAWTPLWPLNVVGGLMSYVPVVLLIAYGDRLPDRRLFRWPARVVALILTVAIPFIIWGPVPAPPS